MAKTPEGFGKWDSAHFSKSKSSSKKGAVPIFHKRLVVAVDGPAGSGKSTISKILARKLGLLYIDTGAMYRALTLKATRLGVDLEDEDLLTKLARETKIDLKESLGGLKVFLDGEDVGGLIRTPELTNNVRYIAGVPGVRKEMVRMQRAIGESRDAVLEGRDIGTVVFPDAPYKFYLDADEKVRVKRRYKELRGMGEKIGMDDIREAVSSRDASDIKRAIGALKKADDAIYIDTTDLSIDEVVEEILSYIKVNSKSQAPNHKWTKDHRPKTKDL